MKLFTQLSLVAAIMCSTALVAFAAPGQPSYAPVNYVYKNASSSVFDDSRTKNADRINAMMYNTPAPSLRTKSVKPDGVIGPSNVMGDLDAPNGETWFYSGKITYDTIPPDYEAGIWFEDHILRAYDFTIYNNKMEVIGRVKDKMRYDEDEHRSPYIDITPLVTQKFFNTDEYYEVIVAVATNPGPGIVRQHSFIYSLNKPDNTDADGNDMPVAHLRSFLGDVLTVSDKLGSEHYIIATAAEHYTGDVSEDDYDFEGDPADSPYWQSLLAQTMTIDIVTNAVNDTDGPRELGSEVIPMTKLQGDQMDAPIVLSTIYEGKPYIAFAQYKDTFYNPYSSPWEEDVTMRESNSLLVKIYTQATPDSQLELFQETEIKFTKDSGVDKLLASYYSIGSLRFRDDIDLNPAHYGNATGKAYLTVTKQNYFAEDEESYTSSYYIYKPDGRRYKTIFTDAQSTIAMSNIAGFEPQQVFVSYETDYTFHFIDLLSVREVCSFTNSYTIDEDQEPELLLANMDRTPAGDSYNYVAELRYPTVDENNNDNIRAIWINADGSFNHIDEVNMGTGVLYAKMYINSAVLHPGVYSQSSDMAYMCLIKRGVEGSDTETEEHLLIAEAKSVNNPDGKSLLQCQPNENGNISSVMTLFSGDTSRLWIVYTHPETGLHTLEVYTLPLVETDDDDAIVEISRPASDRDIVYDLQGRRVANPLRGLYIVNGKKVFK